MSLLFSFSCLNDAIDPDREFTHSALNVPLFAVAAPFVILYMHITDSRF